MKIFQVRSEHLDELSKLFDQYRVFYKSSSDLESAKKFLQDRFKKEDSIIFVVSNKEVLVGFAQLYPSFSSVSMKLIWILNDLFVDESYRKKGIAKLLISAAENFAKGTGAVRIILSTQVSNTIAQSLYESLGYIRNKDFYYYSLLLQE